MSCSSVIKLPECYRVLHVSPGVKWEEIKKSYRALTPKFHPDHHPDIEGSESQQSFFRTILQRRVEKGLAVDLKESVGRLHWTVGEKSVSFGCRKRNQNRFWNSGERRHREDEYLEGSTGCHKIYSSPQHNRWTNFYIEGKSQHRGGVTHQPHRKNPIDLKASS